MNFGSFVSNERYKDQGIDAGYAASRCDRLWRWQCVDPGYGKGVCDEETVRHERRI